MSAAKVKFHLYLITSLTISSVEHCRFRLSEISFVLKAIATLVVSMKKAPASKGESLL